MDYGRVYKSFIASRRLKEAGLMASGEYYEKHHIIPRSLGGKDGAENLICLTPGEHYFAHLCLAQIHGGTQWFAVIMVAMMDAQGKVKKSSLFSKRHMVQIARVKPKKYTAHLCAQSAAKYTTKAEWRKGDNPAFQAAERNGWTADCAAQLHKNVKWSAEKCQAEAAKHTTKQGWKQACPNSYAAATRNGWRDDCSTHMTNQKRAWGFDACLKSAESYETRTAWARGEPQAYNAAWTNQWLGLCCTHMISRKQKAKEKKNAT